MKPRKDNCLKKRKRKEQTYLRVVQSYGEQKEHSHTSEHLDKKKGGEKREKVWFYGKRMSQRQCPSVFIPFILSRQTCGKAKILVLYITILYSAWEICSEKGCWSGYLSGRSRAELPRFQEIWGALRNSCQSVSLSSSSRLTLANENVWRGEEEAGEERWKVCRLFIVCKLNGKCSLSLKKGGWLCLGLSHILCSVRIKSFVSYWSYGNISLGRFSPF